MVTLPPHDLLPPPPPLSGSARRGLAQALDALVELGEELTGRPVLRGRTDELLKQAGAAMARAASALCGLLPPVGTAGPGERSPHDVYMGVQRATLTPGQAAAEAVLVVSRALADLPDAPLHLDDVVAETRAMAAVLAHLLGSPPSREEAGNGEAAGVLRRQDARLAYVPRGNGLERWILVHHLYGLFLLHGAVLLGDAIRALDIGDDERTIAALAATTVYARGATAAMFHAGAVPAHYYGTVIRPTMCPPATPMKLGGSMNPENALYRAAMRRFLARSREPFAELVARRPELAHARDALLACDLLDIERHVAVAAVLVGEERSLLQDEEATENAAGILRRMRNERALSHSPGMRYGDPSALEALMALEAGS